MKSYTLAHENSLITQDGRTIQFIEYGIHGSPIFYFHGFPSSRLEAGRFHELALQHHWRLISADRPGMGLSTFDTHRTLLSWPKDVVAIADFLKIEKFSVVSHSGGAPFLAACAYAIPEKLIHASIVSGMAPLQYPEAWEGMLSNQKIAMKLLRSVPWLAAFMMWITQKSLKNTRILEKMLKTLPLPDRLALNDPSYRKITFESAIEAFRQGRNGPAFEMKLLIQPWGFDLKEIKHPINLWHGSLDTQSPVSHAKLFKKLIPHANLKIIENEGHHSILKNHFVEILQKSL